MKTLLSLLLLCSCLAFAGPDDHEFIEIDTCYHWLQPHQLSSKIDYAKKNNGDLYFYGGSVTYCWRSPLGAQSSWEDHGDELVRIKFKPGTKLVNRSRVNSFQEIEDLGVSGIYSNDNAWHEYTIAPSAVESWSVYHPNTIVEMNAELNFYKAGEVRANDVFYPFHAYDQNWVSSTLSPIIKDQETKSKVSPMIYGSKTQDHFKTKVPLRWHKYLNRTNFTLKEPEVLKIVSATYGLNLSASYLDNVKDKAAAFCDGKMICSYKVATKFIGDPSPGQDKDFKIQWKCGTSKKIETKVIPAPAENKIIELNCNP